MTRVRRVYHAELPREPGRTVELDAEESHHVRRVLRLRPGDRVGVFDGAGTEWEASIVAGPPRAVTLRLESPLEAVVEASIELVLYQGLCKPERMEWVVQKATEVGVAAIHPFTTGRTGPREVTPNRLARWRRVAVEACKQCGRRRLPIVAPRERLPDVTEAGVLATLLDPSEGTPPLTAVLDEGPAARVWIAVGPEGGFEPGEVEDRVRAGWMRARLGPRILRADTAGVIAAALVLHRLGDLGSGAG